MSRVADLRDDDIPLFDRARMAARQRRDHLLDDPVEIENALHAKECFLLGYNRSSAPGKRRDW